jgi:hypothetical protein
MAVTSISTTDTLMRVKRMLQSTFGLILKIATFLAIAVLGGLFTSWYVINQGASFNTERQGSWVKWTMGGRIESDPYSLVRYDRRKVLVYSSTYVSRFEATVDNQNRRLHSACHYAIEGFPPRSAWWSLNVFDAAGGLIPNDSDRHGFNSATIIPSSDGTMRIDLAREARPGNWIPTSRAGRLVVVLEVQNQTGDANVLADGQKQPLPTIRRIGC